MTTEELLHEMDLLLTILAQDAQNRQETETVNKIIKFQTALQQGIDELTKKDSNLVCFNELKYLPVEFWHRGVLYIADSIGSNPEHGKLTVWAAHEKPNTLYTIWRDW